MVYVVDGKVFTGHKPQGEEYQREATKFSHVGPLDLEIGDYHLYVCAACPWAHRALITRNLSSKLREKVIVSVVSPFRDDDVGWEFLSAENQHKVMQFTSLPVTTDASPVRAEFLSDIYLSAKKDYTGNITTPVLYDARRNVIVSNDSFNIMRIFAETDVAGLGSLYQDREQIDKIGRELDDGLAKRVYMCGLAKSQFAYEESLDHVVRTLDCMEVVFEEFGENHQYLHFSGFSLADIQLVSCLLRFDPVYFDLFKCYHRRISSYPNLSRYLRSVVQNDIKSVNLSLDLPQIIHHYWTNFTSCNPNGVIPIAYMQDYLDGGIELYKDDGAREVDDDGQTSASERRARGEFVRGVSAHRNWLGDEEFPLEEDRYVLFIANNCPWCHRVRLARSTYNMQSYISISVLFYRRGGVEDRWRFLPITKAERMDFELENPDILIGIDHRDPTNNGFRYAPDIYKLSDPTSTQTSLPILFDTKTKRVVSNESADLVRMFNLLSGSLDQTMLPEIDALNGRIYEDINNGAYRAGFSSNQEAYNTAATNYFKAFDWLNNLLRDRKFLTGDKLTESDIRLFPTIFRHDPVYHSRMKLNVAMVRDYTHLNRWFLDMMNVPGVREASRLDHCIAGYFGRTGNQLVPFVGLEHNGTQEY